jgi:hypothetical protein
MVDHHERWWSVAAIGVAAATLTSRDEARSAHRFRILDRLDTG